MVAMEITSTILHLQLLATPEPRAAGTATAAAIVASAAAIVRVAAAAIVVFGVVDLNSLYVLYFP
ncbi:hypothetical protein SOVF_211320 [Spinacia oleracea]|nr:hypothetical protein SOVF_211320 [Spinacia oleracea]